MLSALIASKIATVAIASTVAVGGTAAAAYAGALPAPLQDLAHQTIGAQAVDSDSAGDSQDAGDTPTADATDDPTGEPTDGATDDPTGEPTDAPTSNPTDGASDDPTGEPTDSAARGIGPDATGPAAFGLCNAWSHGGLSVNSVAYAALVKAAGAADGVQTYCATIPHPGSGHPTAAPTDDASGQPATDEVAAAHSHPAGGSSHKTGGHGHHGHRGHHRRG